jgi:hypothetical protein
MSVECQEFKLIAEWIAQRYDRSNLTEVGVVRYTKNSVVG